MEEWLFVKDERCPICLFLLWSSSAGRIERMRDLQLPRASGVAPRVILPLMH